MMSIKIRLEKFTINDFIDYYQLVSDGKVIEMITESAIPLDQAKSDYEKIIENNKLSQYFGNFKILDSISNEFIGLAKLDIKAETSD